MSRDSHSAKSFVSHQVVSLFTETILQVVNHSEAEEAVRFGGSIAHHHGLGKARAHMVWEEYGSSFYMLETLKKAFDPNGIMNMGTLIPIKHDKENPWHF